MGQVEEVAKPQADRVPGLERLGDAIQATNELRELLAWFARHVSTAAARTIRHVRLVLWLNALAALVLVAQGAWWGGYIWAGIGPGLLLVAIPAVLVWVCHRVLAAAVALPERIAGLSDTVIEAIREFGPQVAALPEERWGLITRWKSYVLYGRILWRLRGTHGEVQGLYESVGASVLAANPLFWAVMFAAVALSAVVSVGVVLGCVMGVVLAWAW